jgi:hypothetical protein
MEQHLLGMNAQDKFEYPKTLFCKPKIVKSYLVKGADLPDFRTFFPCLRGVSTSDPSNRLCEHPPRRRIIDDLVDGVKTHRYDEPDDRRQAQFGHAGQIMPGTHTRPRGSRRWV